MTQKVIFNAFFLGLGVFFVLGICCGCGPQRSNPEEEEVAGFNRKTLPAVMLDSMNESSSITAKVVEVNCAEVPSESGVIYKMISISVVDNDGEKYAITKINATDSEYERASQLKAGTVYEFPGILRAAKAEVLLRGQP